ICPTTGKMMWSGTFGGAAPAVPAARPRIAARKRTARAVVRWGLIRTVAPKSERITADSAAVECAAHEDRRLRQARAGGKPQVEPGDEAPRPLRRGGAQPF